MTQGVPQDRAPIYAILHHPRIYAARSGLFPLVEALAAEPIFYKISWEHLQDFSWRMGDALKRWGDSHYGSTWNAIIPYWDEFRFLRRLNKRRPGVVHFMFGEFASPKRIRSYRKRGARSLVGTFHCSARRQRNVMASWRDFREYDGITLMSRTQIPFFVERGYPEDRLRVILHGVDARYFAPDPSRPTGDGPLRMLIVGNTERDHEFMARVLKSLPPARFHLDVCAGSIHHHHYSGLPHATIHSFVGDEALLKLYQHADILTIPLLDCTANNAVMEAMACGTPVIANRIGGIPEYVADSVGWIVDGKHVEDWVDRLTHLEERRSEIASMRLEARTWAGRFDWSLIAGQYCDFYSHLQA